MPTISLIAEDYGHEEFLTALILRLSEEVGIHVRLRVISSRGGRVIPELRRYAADLRQNAERLPDALVVAADANCKGVAARRDELREAAGEFTDWMIPAIPDPHVERWLLLDSHAFKSVLGTGCSAPDQKCNRDRYKQILLQAMRNAGIEPPLGGLEYARDIVARMDLHHIQRRGDSLAHLASDLTALFNRWKDAKTP